MRKLVILLALIAQPVMADHYLVSIPSNTMAQLVLEQNVPMPDFAEVDAGYVRGIIEANSKYTSMYIDNSEELFSLNVVAYQKLRTTCGQVTPSCVFKTFDDPGYGKASFD